MARLTRRSRNNSYKELLTVGDNNIGLLSTLQNIVDGSGTESLVQISTLGLNIASGGTLTLGGSSVVTGSVLTTVSEEGTALNSRDTINFIGAGITAADDSGNSRTNITLDATLNSISALGTAADKLAYTTGIDTWAETTITSFGRSLIDDAAASNARTTLGVVIGTNVQAHDATLDAFAAYNTAGLLTQTAADTFTGRTLTGTSNVITVTNGNGVSGNPTITISATYVGQSSITTLGTITTGVWTGTDIAVADGGTGAGTAAGARTNLGLVIGTDVQAYSSKLANFVSSNLSIATSTISSSTDLIIAAADASNNIFVSGTLGLNIFRYTDSNTNAVRSPLQLERYTSGTAAANIGGALNIYVENDAGDQVAALRLDATYTVVTAGAEVSICDLRILSSADSALRIAYRFTTAEVGSSRTEFAQANTATRVITFPDNAINFTDATQAQMEAATAGGVFVTPGSVNWNPGVAKGWALFNGTGTPALTASHNVSSITDNGAGSWGLNWAVAFSSASYCTTGNTGTAGITLSFPTHTAGRGQVRTSDVSDQARIFVAAHGDQ